MAWRGLARVSPMARARVVAPTCNAALPDAKRRAEVSRGIACDHLKFQMSVPHRSAALATRAANQRCGVLPYLRSVANCSGLSVWLYAGERVWWRARGYAVARCRRVGAQRPRTNQPAWPARQNEMQVSSWHWVRARTAHRARRRRHRDTGKRPGRPGRQQQGRRKAQGTRGTAPPDDPALPAVDFCLKASAICPKGRGPRRPPRPTAQTPRHGNAARQTRAPATWQTQGTGHKGHSPSR